MANQRDINRWKKGKDHWNKWARGRLKAKEKLEKEGKWEVDQWGEEANAETKRWSDSATVDFSEHVFTENTDFNDFLFPHNTNFNGVIFLKGAGFNGTEFKGALEFRKSFFQNNSGFFQVKFSDDTNFDDTRFDAETRFHDSLFQGRANFNNVIFVDGARFDGAIFNKNVSFHKTNFQNETWFDAAVFKKNSYWLDAIFEAKISFSGVVFSGANWFFRTSFYSDADFHRVKFSEDTNFTEAHFSYAAIFDQCIFDGPVSFNSSTFSGKTSFNSAKSDGPFSLADAKFGQVPNFIQMSFRAPTRLDDLKVIQAISFQKEGDRERAARYRALKKLAIESHDHVREQEFYASELRERRGNDDPVGSPRYILSFIYELLSNFGSSLKRPLAGLFVTWLVMAAAYGTAVPAAARQGCGWNTTWLTPEHYLSLLHTLPFVGLVRSGRRELALKCLYGSKTGFGAGTDVIFIAHNIFAAILIFLFFLAVRNHFKIK